MKILKYPLNPNINMKTKGEKERTVIFRCYDYKLKNKLSLDNVTTEETSQACIALSLPNNFTEDLSQNWTAEQILSAGSILGKAQEKIKSITGGLVSNLSQSKLGFIANPSEELMYQGPNLRSFSFDYDFVPTSQNELFSVKNILIMFKRFSLPRLAKDLTFISYPGVWKLTMSGFDEDDMSRLITFGINNQPFALTSLNINYTPEGSWYSFEDGFPVKISISMTMSEIKPQYRDGFSDEDVGSEVNGISDSIAMLGRSAFG